jgi:hypothetical protein
MILKVRCYCDELQYRVQWLGYKTDRKWYYASVFEGALINVSSLGLASFFGSIISHVRSYQQ